jgi:hypothetical protein
MEDLWNLIKIKENKISQIKERKRLEEMQLELTSQIEVLEPIVKQTTGLSKCSHTRDIL